MLIHPHARAANPTITRKGVAIGLRPSRPPPMDPDSTFVQQALLDRRTSRPLPLWQRAIGWVVRWI